MDFKNKKLLNAYSLGHVSRSTPLFEKHLFHSLLYATCKPLTAVADVAISKVGVKCKMLTLCLELASREAGFLKACLVLSQWRCGFFATEKSTKKLAGQ